MLTDRDGTPVQGAQVSGDGDAAARADHATPLAFQAVAPGRYVAAAALAAPGQWDLLFSIDDGSGRLHATRRVIVR